MRLRTKQYVWPLLIALGCIFFALDAFAQAHANTLSQFSDHRPSLQNVSASNATWQRLVVSELPVNRFSQNQDKQNGLINQSGRLRPQRPLYINVAPGQALQFRRSFKDETLDPEGNREFTRIDVHVAQGRGVFKANADKRWLSDQLFYQNSHSRPVWLMLRAERVTQELHVFTRHHNKLKSVDEWLDQGAELEGFTSIATVSKSSSRALRFLEQHSYFEYTAKQDVRLKLDYYADFSGVADATNLPVELNWSIDEQAEQSRTFYANPNFREQHRLQCALQLGFVNSTIIELKEAQTIKLKASHNGYLGLSSNRARDYLFNANRPELQQHGTLNPGAATIEQKWYTLLRALKLPIKLNLSDHNNKHLRRRGLTPKSNSRPSKSLYSARGAALKKTSTQLYFTAANSYSNYQKLVLGNYYVLDQNTRSKTFSLPGNRSVSELELEVAVANSTEGLIPLKVQFDNSSSSEWLIARRLINWIEQPSLLSAFLEISIEQDQSNHVGESNSFSRFKEKAPIIRTGIAYIPAPADATSARVFVDNTATTTSASDIWVSLRDFSYRSAINDAEFLKAPEQRTIEQMFRAFGLFKKFAASSIDKPSLIQQLESLPKSEQIDLIIWSRWFEVVRQAWLESHHGLQQASSESGVTRLEKADRAWLSTLEKMLTANHPEMAIKYLAGIALYTPALETRQQALELLYAYAETSVSLSRLEKITLAALYQDMQLLPLIREDLLWLLSRRGKYALIRALPKPAQNQEYDILTTIAARNEQRAQQLLENPELNLSPEFNNLKQLYKSIHADKGLDLANRFRVLPFRASNTEQIEMLQRFGFWRSNNRPVREFDQHIRLNNVARSTLQIDAFIIGPKKRVQLASKQLGRYRLKVAPISSLEKVDQSDPVNIKALKRIQLSNNQADRQRYISGTPATNWWIETGTGNDNEQQPALTEKHFVDAFSTLPIDQTFIETGVLSITADQPSVVYLERLEDPLSLLQMQSISNDAVKVDNADLAPIQDRNQFADLRSTLLVDDCNENRSASLIQTYWHRPLGIEQISVNTEPARKLMTKWATSSLTCGDTVLPVESCLNEFATGLNQRNIGSAAGLLYLTQQSPIKSSLPGVRSSVFKTMSWRELNDVRSPAGSIKINETGETPLTTLALQRQQLSSNSLNSPYRVSGESIQGFSFYSNLNSSGSITLLVEKIEFEASREVMAWLEISGAKPKAISLQTGTSKKMLIDIVEGNNNIKIWLDPKNSSDSLAIAFDQASDFDLSRTNKYHLATPTQPILLKVLGPQWLKSIEHQGDRFNIKEQYIPKGWQTLEFKGTAGSQSLYRFHVLQEKYRPLLPGKSASLSNVFTTANAPTETRLNRAHKIVFAKQLVPLSSLASVASLAPPSARESFFGDDVSDIKLTKRLKANKNFFFEQTNNGVEPITYGLELTYADRQNGEDDFDVDTNLESDFFELHSFIRQYNADNGRLISFDARHRDYNRADVDQLMLRHDWLPTQGSNGFSLATALEAWRQEPQAEQASVSSARLSTHLRYQTEPAYRHRLSTRLDAWQRARRIDNNPDFDLIDPDVWSLYKENHKRGGSLAQRWAYRSHLDAQVYADARVLLNDDFTSIDRNSWQVGWRTYIKRSSLDINLINRRFFKDQDRSNAFTRNDLRASTDWLLPVSDESNLKLGIRAQYNIDDEELSWWLNIGWFRHAGQQLHDFRPGEYRFRSARNWWLNRSPNNNKVDAE